MMKAMGGAKRGPLAGLANALGMGGGMPSPEQLAKLAEKMPGGMPGGLPGRRNTRRPARRIARRAQAAADISGRARRVARPPEGAAARARRISRASARRNNRFTPCRKTTRCRKDCPMSLKIRMARAGTKKRPVYHIVVADSRYPRDGRFIERLGYFNPLLPKENTDRLKFDIEKAKSWLAKGATPSDRILRFLDAAGVRKRAARNNPEKALPRKERKARAEAAAKAAAAKAAAAKAPGAAGRPVDLRPSRRARRALRRGAGARIALRWRRRRRTPAGSIRRSKASRSASRGSAPPTAPSAKSGCGRSPPIRRRSAAMARSTTADGRSDRDRVAAAHQGVLHRPHQRRDRPQWRRAAAQCRSFRPARPPAAAGGGRVLLRRPDRPCRRGHRRPSDRHRHRRP